MLQRFVHGEEKRVVEWKGGAPKSGLEIDGLEAELPDGALCFFDRAPAEPLRIDRPDADEFGMT